MGFFSRKGLLHGMVTCESSTQLFRNVPVKLRANSKQTPIILSCFRDGAVSLLKVR
jgi:hypothetical protein